MRHRAVFALVLLVAGGLGGCSARTSDRSLVFVTPAEGQRAVERGRALLGLVEAAGAWVDPRGRRAYDTAHIPGAVHLPIEEANERHHELDAYDLVVVYGDGDRSPVALAMSKLLMELGHDRVLTLRGGLAGWTAAGNGVE